MQSLRKDMLTTQRGRVTSRIVKPDSPQRAETEAFIKAVFARHYDARVNSFAPNLVRFEQDERTVAAAGWRSAEQEPLFLERYLDQPIEQAIGQQAGREISRARIVEVGNLATTRNGSSLHVIVNLAREFDHLGYEWVVFTATRELISVFSRLGLPLLALSKADPARLGDEAWQWGSYYDQNPIVVAGLIQLASTRLQKQAATSA